jgi:membrane protease YdiL (CAAX protease family)
LLLRTRCPLTALPETRRVSPAILLLVVATPLLTLVAWRVGGIGHPPDGAGRLLAAVVVAAAAFVEELCFRRVVHVGARGVAGRYAFVLSAIVWASGGAATGDAGTVLLLLGAGLVYGLAYDWLGRWWPGALSHAAVAVLVFVVIAPA